MYSELMDKDKGRERKARIGSIDCLETATTSSSIDSQDNDRRMGAEGDARKEWYVSRFGPQVRLRARERAPETFVRP